MADIPALKWVIGEAVKNRSGIGLILVLQVCTAGLMSAQPLAFQRIVSLALGEVRDSFLREGLAAVGLLGLLFTGICLLQGAYGYAAALFSSTLLNRLQHDFFDKFSRLPLNYFRDQSAGEFMTRLNMDIGQTQRLVAATLPLILREILTLVFSMLILMVSCSFLLMLAALGTAAVSALLMLWLNRGLAVHARNQRRAWARINKSFDEAVQGIDTVKVFAGEAPVKAHFDGQTNGLRQISVKAGTLTAVFSPLIDLVSKFGGLCLILLAFYLLFRGYFVPEEFLLFFFYAGLFQNALSSLIQCFSGIQSQAVSAGQLSSFLSEPEEGSHGEGRSAIPDHSVPIRFENLDFAYPGSRTLFQNFTCDIPANAVTLIRGPSGSGKSSLINLLLGFYSPDRGRILIGKRPIRAFPAKELRKKISVATQFHYIFQDTLKQNLSIARPGASDHEIQKALAKAHLTDFTARLPKGIHEVLAPRGMGISGGEKQRICLARLFLRGSPILVLDEPWSNLDREARKTLIRVIHQCRSDTTILILAHEVPAGLNPDRIHELVPDPTGCVSCNLSRTV